MAGRIALTKMVVLPKLLYLFQNIPPSIQNIFPALTCIYDHVSLGRGHPRIGCERLQRPYEKGGFGVPNFEVYYLIAQAKYAHHWGSQFSLGTSHGY